MKREDHQDSTSSDEELELAQAAIGETSVYKVSRSRNITRKMGEIIDWFATGVSSASDSTSDNTTIMTETMHQDMQDFDQIMAQGNSNVRASNVDKNRIAPDAKRFIVITVCLPLNQASED